MTLNYSLPLHFGVEFSGGIMASHSEETMLLSAQGTDMKTRCLIILALLFSVGCNASPCDGESVKSYFDVGVEIDGPLSIETVEERQMIEIDLGDEVQRLPFGRINAEWEKFKSQMMPGDCIFFFTTDETTWEALHGREGYLLVRGSEPVDAIVTKVN